MVEAVAEEYEPRRTSETEQQYHKRTWEQECKVVQKDCDFGDGFFSVHLELSGRKEPGLCYECCPILWGVVWSGEAKVLPNVANPPNFSLSCA